MINEILYKERKILEEKKDLIREELNEKKNNREKINAKVKSLAKESKGSYNEEKETTEKIANVLKKDIEGYEESLLSPYFGRVDFREKRGIEESIYIGKNGITNNIRGEEVVVDWRAPVADLYYSATGGESYYKAPVGVIEGTLSLKRKFLFEDGEINDIFDDGLNELMINGEEGTELVDEFLKINLEESRGKKLKEVVATIQKEQNEIIRWPRNFPIIVQGSAGSGKTTIALHRLAYLIYRYKENMKGEEILVLAPNKLFLDYISEILPNLGAEEVKQSTFEELVQSKFKLKGKIYNKDDKLKDVMEEENLDKKEFIVNCAKFKGSIAYKDMIDKYIALVDSSTREINDITIDGYVIFDKKEIVKLYLKDLKSYPINRRKDEIKRYLSLKIKEKIDVLIYSIDIKWEPKIKEIKSKYEDLEERRRFLIKEYDNRDEIKNHILKNSKKQFNNYFKSWKEIGVKDIYYNFFTDDELFKIVAPKDLSYDLIDFMQQEFLLNHENGIVDEDDLAPLLYIRNLLEGIEEKEKFKHIVVDEAQDYSPFQVYLVNSFAKGNSLTLVGDLAQGIYYYKGLKMWEDITKDLFKDAATYVQLTQSYRSTVEIIDFASGALQAQNLGLKNAKPVLRHGEEPKIVEVENEKEIYKSIDQIIDEIRTLGKISVAVITKDTKEAEKVEKLLKKKSKHKFQRIKGKESSFIEDNVIIPSYLTKGLEFDCTIIYDPSKNKYEKTILDERLLYVMLTRALHYEYILKINELTTLIEKNY
ncbi:RNA polymerase recycling motor HelD [Clostridium uliginosum]|uniref:DNA helicase-2 / ATP-dependent DNA helicase PcrA n=1 Tax=Clostridium uliginosum TaxID=119641 RepID=A0A1I1RTM5_9CLOT|nr:RNA polymerase recycling motor HelD [Clostridium uliginosum]SFD37615.1 DNA helicase-2 / ATP-dependent DNA helicase PcrA [Clostridium uliginosum]